MVSFFERKKSFSRNNVGQATKSVLAKLKVGHLESIELSEVKLLFEEAPASKTYTHEALDVRGTPQSRHLDLSKVSSRVRSGL